MIAMSGKNRGVDVILTADKKTFLPVCKNIDAFAAIVHPELFNYNDTFIFEYYTSKVDDFVQGVKQGKVDAVEQP